MENLESNSEEKNKKEPKVIDVYTVSIERYFHRSTRSWKIVRVKFETNEGWIFFKPYKEKKIHKEVSGKKMCFVNKEMIEFYELPTIISDVSHTASEQGICKIKVHYRVWKRKGMKDYQFFLEEDVMGIEILPIEEKV